MRLPPASPSTCWWPARFVTSGSSRPWRALRRWPPGSGCGASIRSGGGRSAWGPRWRRGTRCSPICRPLDAKRWHAPSARATIATAWSAWNTRRSSHSYASAAESVGSSLSMRSTRRSSDASSSSPSVRISGGSGAGSCARPTKSSAMRSITTGAWCAPTTTPRRCRGSGAARETRSR